MATPPVAITAPHVDLQYELHWDDLPNIATPGQELTYNLQVWNLGTDNLAGTEVTMLWSSDMNITLGDAQACTVDLGAIGAGVLVEFQFDCQAPDLAPGWYYSGVILDPSNAIPESNENNNKGSSVEIQQFQQ